MVSSEWTPEHEVYLPGFDAEHKDLFHHVTEVRSAASSQADLPQLLQATRDLVAAAAGHFAGEESKMRAARYPAYAWHKDQHNAVRKRIDLYLPLVEKGDKDAALQLADYVAGWLDNHTAVTDRMMAAFLRNHERQSR